MNTDLITLTEAGLYCENGGFYIDPWLPVDRAIITHAHSDHAQQGHRSYLTATTGVKLLKARLAERANVESLDYGAQIQIGSVRVSLHSAGHVLGSSQVRIEAKSGEVWVVSGDYKTRFDPTCDPFDPVECHTFITESTFGLPIFRWSDPTIVYESINSWWQNNKKQGKASILYGYALGKIQRLLAGVDPSIGPIYSHGAVEKLVQVYRDSGVKLPETTYVGAMPRGTKYDGALILAPPSAQATPWTRTFGTLSTGFASGWMRIRGTRRRKSVDRGFVLSDHADWNELQHVIKNTGADRIIVTHGYTAEMVRWLSENGLNASSFKTHFEGESRELQAETEPEG